MKISGLKPIWKAMFIALICSRLRLLPAFIWASIQIETTDRLFRLKGAFNSQAEQLASQVKTDWEYIHGVLSDQLKTTLKTPDGPVAPVYGTGCLPVTFVIIQL